MPKELKSTSLAEMLASAKEKAEAYAKLSPEERAAQDKKTAEILAKLGPNGPTTIFIKSK